MEVEVAGEQSEVLTEGEVTDIVEGKEPSEVILDSDKEEFKMPEKFAGKSAEEIAKSYMELEKFKASKEEGGGQESTEGEVPSEPEKGKADDKETKEPTTEEQATYDKYAAEYDENGSLSEEAYEALAKEGYTKEQVDSEIAKREEMKEYQQYKADKQLNSVLEPLGGGKEKFKAVAEWANSDKTEAEMIAFNKALADSPVVAQQALLRGLYAEYEAAGKAEDTILHTNSPQTTPSKGYKTQEEFFKDIGSEEYKNNAAYRAAVEKKMSKSNIF